MTVDRRHTAHWIALGAATVTAVAYLVIGLEWVVVAPSREPSYEPWGLAIKLVEVVLLGALGYLLAGQKSGRRTGAPEPPTRLPRR